MPDTDGWAGPPPRAEPTPRWIRVRAGGEEVADSRRAMLLAWYGRGTAAYWSVRVGDAVHRDVAWSYAKPVPECPRIAGLVAFFNEKVDLVVDGVRQERPVSPWSS